MKDRTGLCYTCTTGRLAYATVLRLQYTYDAVPVWGGLYSDTVHHITVLGTCTVGERSRMPVDYPWHAILRVKLVKANCRWSADPVRWWSDIQVDSLCINSWCGFFPWPRAVCVERSPGVPVRRT